MSLGLTEILVIFVAILLLFGAKRIPEIARALGRASHEFFSRSSEFSVFSAFRHGSVPLT